MFPPVKSHASRSSSTPSLVADASPRTAASKDFGTESVRSILDELLNFDAEVAERQTHQLEGLAGATPWRFESSLPHQQPRRPGFPGLFSSSDEKANESLTEQIGETSACVLPPSDQLQLSFLVLAN